MVKRKNDVLPYRALRSRFQKRARSGLRDRSVTRDGCRDAGRPKQLLAADLDDRVNAGSLKLYSWSCAANSAHHWTALWSAICRFNVVFLVVYPTYYGPFFRANAENHIYEDERIA